LRLQVKTKTNLVKLSFKQILGNQEQIGMTILRMVIWTTQQLSSSQMIPEQDPRPYWVACFLGPFS
jgi:hypothetical protein